MGGELLPEERLTIVDIHKYKNVTCCLTVTVKARVRHMANSAQRAGAPLPTEHRMYQRQVDV